VALQTLKGWRGFHLKHLEQSQGFPYIHIDYTHNGIG